MSLDDFFKLNKTPGDGTCLGEPPGSFCDVGCCCCFYLTGGFYFSGLLFLATGTPPWFLRSVKVSNSSELCPGYFRLLYFCQAFPSHFYRERYAFEPKAFSTLHTSPIFLARFVTKMQTGTPPPPGSSSVPALTESSPFRLTQGLQLLILQLQDHWFIICASEPPSIELKLNYWICFPCSKSYKKTIKTLWTRLDEKYCL